MKVLASLVPISAFLVELYHVQRIPPDRCARVGCSTPFLQKDTFGFANRLTAHRTIAKTRRTSLASTPMAARNEGHNCLFLEADHAL